MKTRGWVLDILDRAEDGPIIEEREFDRVYVRDAVVRLVRKHGVCIPKDTPIPWDDDLADRVYEAGIELAVEAGVFCTSTNRRMVFTRAEIENRLGQFPGHVTLGEGEDACMLQARRPEDAGRVMIVGGAYGTPLSESMFVPIMLSYAQEPLIDWIDNGSLVSVYGRSVRAATPWEILACWQEVDLSMEVIRRAGRPGISIGCAENSSTDLGEISTLTFGGFRPIDWHHTAMISELKTSFEQLNKMVHFQRTGSHIHSFYNVIYGGLVGGREGMAITSVAGMILMQLVYLSDTVNLGPTHLRYSCDTHPDILPGIAVALQALNRNTRLLTSAFTRPYSGPGTKTILYEAAALALVATTSGVAFQESVQSATGVHENHTTGLEARWVAEVCHAAEGMSRVQANDIAKALIGKYETIYKGEQPIGKPFAELYDMRTNRPGSEWQGMYDEVKDELCQLGLHLT